MEPLAAPSALLLAERARIEAASREGPLVELACGRGRNAVVVAGWGVPVVGFDRNADFLTELRGRASASGLPLHAVRADLEAPAGLALRAASCHAIAVFRYLHRPIAPAIANALAPGGVLLYETFTTQQTELGYGPRNPDFLLESGELPSLFGGLELLDYWEGVTDPNPTPEAVARLVARRRPSPRAG